VSLPRSIERNGITPHRRTRFETTRRHGIPVTTPACTIVDLAPRLTASELERVIGEADKLDLIHVQQLHEALEQMRGRPGVAIVRKLIDRRTYVLTHSELERLFPPIAQRAGVTDLQSQVWLDGKRVDFYSPSLEIVFETDGGRFHRTPMQRATDDRRDQDHAAAGRLPLRFGHGQIAFEAEDVEARLTAIVSTRRSRDRSSGRGGPTPPSASAAAAARTRAA
jgi:very-short-patch-repair endonuclease